MHENAVEPGLMLVLLFYPCPFFFRHVRHWQFMGDHILCAFYHVVGLKIVVKERDYLLTLHQPDMVYREVPNSVTGFN